MLLQVRCMMYWIVFALFSAVESLLDPFGNIFLPFYTEVEDTHYYRYRTHHGRR